MELDSFESADSVFTKNWACDECCEKCRCTRRRSVVEVLVSTFNQERTIGAALESIAKQTIETSLLSVFISDDCSNDRTIEVAIDFLTKSMIPFTISRAKTNRFSAIGFSFFIDAVFECRSEFIAFLDGDDEWRMPSKLELQILELRNAPSAEICHTAYEVWDGSSSSIQPDQSIHRQKLESRTFLRRENFVGTLTAVLRTSSLKIRPKQESLRGIPSGDYPIWLVATSEPNSKLVYLDQVTARYNIHNGNYWATGGLLSKFSRARKAQRFVSRALGETVGQTTIVFVLRVVWRRMWSRLGLRTGGRG